ncbi:MAG: hypothetical protein JW940_04915 [Polyangiaceae bacterium]|nr:hypothetical protein [Polyangiaceae bacterium]
MTNTPTPERIVPAAPVVVPPTDPRIAVMGRVARTSAGALRFGYPGVTLRLVATGSDVALRASCSTGNCRLAVSVDGDRARVVRVPVEPADLSLASGVGPGPHGVEIVHRTETWQGIVTVSGFVLPAGAELAAPPPWPERKLLFIGDSVTCGEGADRASAVPGDTAASSDATRSYGMLVAAALGAQCHLVCYGGRGLIRDWQGRRDVLNAPEFEELSLAVEDERVAWDYRAYQPDAIVVSLGTNDFNLGIGPLPAEREFVDAYARFLRALRGRYPAAKTAVTEGAIVNDEADPARPQKTVLRRYLAATVRQLADPGVVFLPSRHYPGDATNAHPTGEQHAAMARDLEGPLRALVGWRR